MVFFFIIMMETTQVISAKMKPVNFSTEKTARNCFPEIGNALPLTSLS